MTASSYWDQHWRTTLCAAVLVGLCVLLYLLSGAGSECRTDSDCAPGQQCMTVTLPEPSGIHRFISPKACETPCRKDSDCPRGYECRMVDHGPGPDPFCLATERTSERSPSTP